MLKICLFAACLAVYLVCVVLYAIGNPFAAQPRSQPPAAAAAAARQTGEATPVALTMNAFLRKAKQLRTLEIQEPLLLIIGNESCDLDSAVAAIGLAYFYGQQQQPPPPSSLPPRRAVGTAHIMLPDLLQRYRFRADRIVPVLNVARDMLATKTEVTFHLRQHQIELDSVLCRDEIPDAVLARAQFVLVDHHISPFASRTLQVIDHRPLDPAGFAQMPSACLWRNETVGSCCTLIADMILEQHELCIGTSAAQQELFRLLYAVIVLDTVNFAAAADRARPLDHEVCEKIERIWAETRNNTSAIVNISEYRQYLFDSLVRARSNVAELNALQLLHKDMKLATRAGGGTVVPIAGLPISLRGFALMAQSARAVRTLAQQCGSEVVVLMSMVVGTDGSVSRELAVLQTSDTQRASRLRSDLMRELCGAAAALQLSEESREDRDDLLGGTFYRQGNVKASRKQVLPIVQRVVNGK